MVPLVVLTELEAKRNHPELGWAARQALRALEELRTEHGTLVRPLPVNDGGGTLRVEINHQELAGLPAALPLGGQRPPHPRRRPQPGQRGRATSPSSPRTCRCASRRASSAWPPTSTATSWWPTRAGPASSSSTSSPALIDDAVRGPRRRPPRGPRPPCHTGLALHAGSQSALARVRADKRLHLVRDRRRGVRRARPLGRAARRHRPARPTPRSASSASAATPAPARACSRWPPGWRPCSRRRTHKRVVVFRPLYAVGGQDLGFLPGDRGREDGPVGGRGHRRPRVGR